MKVGIKFINPYVTIMYRNDELSLLFTKYSELFILFAENYQILLKISVIPILLTSIYLVALNLLVNNQLNSSLRHIIVTLDFNTAPPLQKGGNDTRCISCKRAALYINLMQAPHTA